MALVVVAVLWLRPDLLVLATPFAVVAVWSAVTRPDAPPVFEDGLDNVTIREGDATTWRGTVTGSGHDTGSREGDADSTGDGTAHRDGGIDLVAAAFPADPWVQLQPVAGTVTVAAAGGRADVAVALRAIRWGRRVIDPVEVAVASTWGAFRWSTRSAIRTVTTLPQPALFDTTGPVRPTAGLVGLYRSVRPGEGSEFAGIRDFQVGDKMRRINWSRSLRSDRLHVNSTWAELDTHVALVLDATGDFGVSEGVDGLASSLDETVRAAGAIAEHYIRSGDRVSLRTFGSSAVPALPAATGQAHLRRILDALTVVRPGGSRAIRASGHGHLASGDGQLTVMLSPLIAREALDRAVQIGRRGMPVVMVDTLPIHVTVDEDPLMALAWRIRLLERRREIRLVEQAGIPVVQWLGPGSIDQFLRDVARRVAAPRMRQL